MVAHPCVTFLSREHDPFYTYLGFHQSIKATLFHTYLGSHQSISDIIKSVIPITKIGPKCFFY